MRHVLSFSSLKEFAKSPAHFLEYKKGKKTESTAMRFGTAVHMAVLEPEKFAGVYDVTDLRKNTKAYKLMIEENPDQTFMNNSDWRGINNIKDEVRKHNLANELIYGADRYEEEIKGDIKGVPFRGFIDAIGTNYLVDLKTTQNSSPKEFQRSAYNFQYYLQAAIYCEITGLSDFWIVAAESSAPHNVVPYLLDSKYIERGREELYMLIEKYKKWISDDNNLKKIGYDYELGDQSFFTLKPPKWAV